MIGFFRVSRASLRWRCLVFAGALLPLVSCSAGSDPGRGPYSGAPIRITGTEFSFDAPDALPAGEIPIEFANRGDALHELVIIRLGVGATLEDLRGLRAGGSDQIEIAGKVGPITTGEVERTVASLDPGDYGMACFVIGPDGRRTHAALGMVGRFTVE